MRRLMLVSKVFLSGALVVAVMSGCSSSASRPRGTIVGRLEMVGNPGDLIIRDTGAVTATPISGGATSTVHADIGGRFRLVLPPGKYKLTGTSPKFGAATGVCLPGGPATVIGGNTTLMNVLCHMR